jgi:hypothetical protein
MIDTSNAIKKGGKPGETLIRKNDMVSVVGTGNGRFIKKGAKLDLHRSHADDLVSKGAVKIVGDVNPEKTKNRVRKVQ